MAIDINTVIENLNELLTNSVNLTDKYYDLFINPEPMMIDLELYNEDNELVTVTVPNRAMDRENFGQLIDKVDALAEIASTGEYVDLKNVPEGTLTIQGNGTTVATFSNGSGEDVTADIQFPTKTSQLVNDSGFITSVTLPIHALKGYLDEGELLEDEEGLTDVTYYAHSTFDLSKFTAIGTPIISDDGIVSGFTTNSYISGTPLDVSSAGTSWDFEFTCHIDSTISSSSYIVWSSLAENGLIVTISSTGVSIPNIAQVSGDISVNSDIQIKVHCDVTNNLITLTVYKNGVLLGTDSGTGGNYLSGVLYLGARPELGSSAFTGGSIDLKTVLVRIDEFPVFSGNQTGIDTYNISNTDVEIPYTLSKTGSKIVDSVYRTEVNSVYSELGYSPYYTISDVDYTIPQGELYGYIKKEIKNTVPEVDLTFSRNIGEIVQSTIPLVDAGLHSLDGSVLQYGSYKEFIDYIASFPTDSPIFAQPISSGTITTRAFTQPTLSTNGTIGGSSFAVKGSSEQTGYGRYAWKAVDGNTSTFWGSSVSNQGWLEIYNPNPLNITSVSWQNYNASYRPTTMRIYGGNTEESLQVLMDFSNFSTSSATTTINMSSNTGYYKIYRFETLGQAYSNTSLTCVELSITATEQIGAESKTAEEVWQETVGTYGVCGKFVYDNTNRTVRLPKYSNKIYSSSINLTSPVIGNGMPIALTNGKNDEPKFGISYGSSGGALYGGCGANAGSLGHQLPISGGTTTTGTAANLDMLGLTNDATKSGMIADLSNITKPLDGYYYIVVATSTKTDIQVDIDEIATDLNGKADTDLTNVSNTSGFRKLVEIYNDGTSWYKIYNEYDTTTGNFIGQWCEQGSTATFTSGAVGAKTIDLVYYPYKDTNYTLIVGKNTSDINVHNGTASYFAGYANKTTSSFVTTTGNTATGDYAVSNEVSYLAAGYIS